MTRPVKRDHRLHIMLGRDELRMLDALCTKSGLDRSSFVRTVIRELFSYKDAPGGDVWYLAKTDKPVAPFLSRRKGHG